MAVATLHGCGDSNSEEKVSGVGMFTSDKDSGANAQLAPGDVGKPIVRGNTKPFPALPPVYPTLANLQGHPQEFPKGYPVPQFPQSSVKLVRIEREQHPGIKNQVDLVAPATPHLVDAYYQLQMVKDGWTQIHGDENSAYGCSTWRKDGQEATILVSRNPHGQENIQLFWGMEPHPRNKARLGY